PARVPARRRCSPAAARRLLPTRTAAPARACSYRWSRSSVLPRLPTVVPAHPPQPAELRIGVEIDFVHGEQVGRGGYSTQFHDFDLHAPSVVEAFDAHHALDVVSGHGGQGLTCPGDHVGDGRLSSARRGSCLLV